MGWLNMCFWYTENEFIKYFKQYVCVLVLGKTRKSTLSTSRVQFDSIFSPINLHKQYVDVKFFWYRNIEIWDLFLGFAMQEGLQTVKSPYKAMSVLQIKWYKEASRAMLYYVNWRHFNVITWKMCSEFGAKKGTSVIAVL